METSASASASFSTHATGSTGVSNTQHFALTLTQVPQSYNNPELKNDFAPYNPKKCQICYRPQHMGWGVVFFYDESSLDNALYEMESGASGKLPKQIKFRKSSDLDIKKITQKKKGGGATKRDLNPQPRIEKIKSNDEILKELFIDRDYNKQRTEYNILENYLLSIDGDMSEHKFCILNFTKAYEVEDEDIIAPCEVALVQFTLLKRETNSLASLIYPFDKHDPKNLVLNKEVMKNYRELQNDFHGVEDHLLKKYHDYGAIWRDICAFASSSGRLLLSRSDKYVHNELMLNWLVNNTEYENPFIHCKIEDLLYALQNFSCMKQDMTKYFNTPVITGGRCYIHSILDIDFYCSMAQSKQEAKAVCKFARDIFFTARYEGEIPISISARMEDENLIAQRTFYQSGGKRLAKKTD